MFGFFFLVHFCFEFLIFDSSQILVSKACRDIRGWGWGILSGSCGSQGHTEYLQRHSVRYKPGLLVEKQPRRARWWRKPGVGRIRSSGPGGNLGYGRTATRLLRLLLNYLIIRVAHYHQHKQQSPSPPPEDEASHGHDDQGTKDTSKDCSTDDTWGESTREARQEVFTASQRARWGRGCGGGE